MAKNLVIVESPTKAKTIKKFLGKNYEVIASEGHVRDLPRSSMGIDKENDFEPHYITIRGKGELVATLKKAAKKADFVYLATDPDREGEAISYHLSVALKLDEKSYKRITFNEITKNAVKDSIKKARAIDMDLVDAQQARRVVDRLVGYEISPLLWEKLGKRSLSAGRVQSVALKMISDRENEINDFIPEEYWTIDTYLKVPGQKTSALFNINKKDLKDEKTASELKKKLDKSVFKVSDIKKSNRSKKAPVPFTTSTLQQTAASRINFSTSKTMRVAQQLYEGVDLNGDGTVGLITYLRTDSTRVSDEADRNARKFIKEKYGEEYVADSIVADNGKTKNIQDAHEAIRPTDVSRTPAYVKPYVTAEQYKLYKLIYERFVASRMKPAVYDIFTVSVEASGEVLKCSESTVSFAGYLNVYSTEEDKIKTTNLSGISIGDELKLDKVEAKQHFTEPPAHYTESLLVKTMEENGIGRPSTYAPTISTLLNRRYITKEQKNLYITELGEAVNGIMITAFPEIVDVEFTANMESLLDSIGEGAIDWKVVVRNFYPDLEKEIKNASKNLEKIKIADETTDEICEECGANMVIKYGAYGKFLACPNFPNCRNTKPYFEKIGVRCPECGSEIVKRNTKKGRPFYGCINYPECEFMSWNRPLAKKCPECGKMMIVKGKKAVCSDAACGYTEKLEEDL